MNIIQERFASFLDFTIIQMPVSASVCHIQHNTRRLCWPLLFSVSIILPSDVIKASTCRPSPRAHLHVLGMLRLMPCHKPTELVHSFLFVLVSVSVFMALSTVFYSIHSPDNSPLSHSVLPSYFCLIGLYIYISLYKSLPQPLYNPLCSVQNTLFSV